MRCEGLTALQAADFSIGGNGGKVKQQCAPGAMSPGAKGAGNDALACGESLARMPAQAAGAPLTTAPGTSGGGQDEKA